MGDAVKTTSDPLHTAPAGEATMDTPAGKSGLTVTVTVKGSPEQFPAVDKGVTTYSTVPADELPGFVSSWAIEVPVEGLAPVMPPVIVPTVQLKVPEADAVKGMFVVSPLQIVAVDGDVETGLAFTVTVMEYGKP